MVAIRSDIPDELSEEAYLRVALADPQGQWELVDGRLREKPAMSACHGFTMSGLGKALLIQRDPAAFQVRFGHARLRVSPTLSFIPDIAVIAAAFDPVLQGDAEVVDAFVDPLPLVVEIWSPSTGSYDLETKIPAYQRRGDREIWRLHPRDRTLTTWIRQADGSYRETMYRSGTVRPVYLPNVTISLDALFVG